MAALSIQLPRRAPPHEARTAWHLLIDTPWQEIRGSASLGDLVYCNLSILIENPLDRHIEALCAVSVDTNLSKHDFWKFTKACNVDRKHNGHSNLSHSTKA
jgi:hypothetical protein